MLKLIMYLIHQKPNLSLQYSSLQAILGFSRNRNVTGSSLAIFLSNNLLLSIFLMSISNALWAASNVSLEQDNTPVNIQSDSANFDEKKGLAIHQGHVLITQGSRLLSADHLEIYRNKEGKIQSIIAKGSPASFEANPDPNKPKIFGQANTLQYYPKENKIILVDSAELKQEDKTLQGALITYHFDTQTLESDAKANQRTTVILKNKEKQ